MNRQTLASRATSCQISPTSACFPWRFSCWACNLSRPAIGPPGVVVRQARHALAGETGTAFSGLRRKCFTPGTFLEDVKIARLHRASDDRSSFWAVELPEQPIGHVLQGLNDVEAL